MKTKLNTYSFTLDKFYIETLKKQIKERKIAEVTSLSNYINNLIAEDFKKRNIEPEEPKGNLYDWLQKRKADRKEYTKKPFTSNKQLMEEYVNDKFGR